MRTAILLAMLCPLLQGCVGVVVPGPRTEIIDNPTISSYVREPDGVTKRNSSEATNSVVYTSEWLLTRWGTPQSIRHVAGSSDEIWIYKSGTIWAGVVPFVLIPVPLMLPISKEKVSFSLHDRRVVRATVTKPWVVGGTFGFIPNPEGGGTFGTWNWKDSVK